MLELSKRELFFVYSETSPLLTTLTVKNTSPTSLISFKIKTTTPQLFDVNPSKGILTQGQTKIVQFRTHNALRRQQAQNILQRQRFLVQYLTLSDRKSPAEIEQLWQRNKSNKAVINNIKLPIRIQGVSEIGGQSQNGPQLFSSVQSGKFLEGRDTRTPFEAGSDQGESNSQLGNKLDELNREEERLMAERSGEFSKATRPSGGKSKIATWCTRLFTLLVFCAIGFGIHKFLEYRRNRPKVLTQTDYTTVTSQNKVVQHGGQSIDQNTIVIDSKAHPTNEHIVIKTPSQQAIQRRMASRSRDIEAEEQRQAEERWQMHEQLLERQRQQSAAAEAEYQRRHQSHKKIIVTAPKDTQIEFQKGDAIQIQVVGAQKYMDGH